MRRLNRPIWGAIVLTAVPLLIWSGMQPFFSRWTDGTAALQSLSQVTGIAGMMLFAYTLAIGARFRWVERLLGPLNEVYIAHHLLGAVAFSCLLTHPIFAILYVFSAKLPNIAHYIVPGLDNALTWGILGLWTLAVLMVLTLYLRPRYPLWRRTHQFLGLALFFAGLHGFYISSDISASPALRAYLLLFTLGALALFVAYTVLNRVTVRRYPYRIASVNRLSDAVMSIRLVPTGAPLLSEPGRFIFVSFLIDGRWSEAHPFSLASAADTEGLSISLKALGDDTVRFFERLTEDMPARIEGPFGAFGAEMHDTPRVICVAGGIGVTPFLSLLPSLTTTQLADVYYAVRSAQEGVHLEELRRIADRMGPRVRIFPWYSDVQGLLTVQDIHERSVLTEDDHLFLCGPPTLMRAIRSQAKAVGLPESHIHSEEFALL